jgi:hypothetical protein
MNCSSHLHTKIWFIVSFYIKQKENKNTRGGFKNMVNPSASDA